MPDKLVVEDLHVSVNGKQILKGASLEIETGSVHALMGPNGSGKSTLAHALMGHPKYSIDKGRILLNDEDITNLPPNERAKKGLFLSFQHPAEITGLKLTSFLRNAYNSIHNTNLSVVEFHKLLKEKMQELSMNPEMIKRALNEGFSGGEKKRMETLQLMLLQPKFAILDETDSGLDVDALRIVAQEINKMRGKNMGILIITHHRRILDYISPDKVHVMSDGKIVKTGERVLANEIEEKGYEAATT
ncbi:MAG: Fe-S cluster assembly ATPase SufC [Candidatus Aenigmarchaeota archaeon]|nr:Fe-S cluster assembly ATPase SufC [Candidatus Aenigmarchaeota archaeon]